jgi:hypothetical protein
LNKRLAVGWGRPGLTARAKPDSLSEARCERQSNHEVE